jgi:hypothetical protein
VVNRILVGGFVAAVAGAAMVAISSVPASAFTLSSPSLEAPVAGANIDRVYYPYRHYRYGYYPYRHYHHGYYHHCWNCRRW